MTKIDKLKEIKLTVNQLIVKLEAQLFVEGEDAYNFNDQPTNKKNHEIMIELK